MLQSDDPTAILFKLSDFGRASRAGEDRDGEDLGDARYLPCLDDLSTTPSRAATARDIYALGMTIYHAVSLTCLPFTLFTSTGTLVSIYMHA